MWTFYFELSCNIKMKLLIICITDYGSIDLIMKFILGKGIYWNMYCQANPVL